MLRRPLLLSALMAIVAALSACGDADGRKTSGQIAAIVNGEEISVHRVNGAIARSDDSPSGEAGQAAAQALQEVIDQELLVRKALDAKLDRDPQVMQAIEDAKRQILARAYIDRTVTAASPESQEEIRTFYRENPALFERRRIYRVNELVVTAPQEKLGALKASAAGAKSLEEMAQWLKSQKLPFDLVTTRRPAEKIRMDILPRLFEMRDGQIAVFSTSRGASVVQLVQFEEAPLSEQQAAPIIERFLLNRKRLELARAEVRKLREKAKIEYVGEFKPAHPGEPARSSAKPGGEEGGYIEKGLTGLR